MAKILEDANGNKSSKRVFGAIGMGLFFVSSIGIAVYSVSTGNDVGVNATQLVTWVGVVSGSLLGIGVVEHLANGNRNNNNTSDR